MRLEHFWEAHLVQNMPFLTSKFWFFLIHCHVLSVWVAESWKCSKFGHDRRLGNLTRENILNDEYLSQFLPDCKVLWMTLEQLFEILIKVTIFDNSRAICVLILWQNHLLFPSGREKARRTWKFSHDSFPRSHWIDQNRRQNRWDSYINKMTNPSTVNTYCMSNMYCEKCQSTGKSTWNQSLSFASFVC